MQEESKKVKPQLFKKGQSGNPRGKIPGTISLKVFARNYLKSLSDEDKVDFLNELPPSLVWQMAEGNPDNKTSLDVKTKVQFTDEELDNAKQLIIRRISDGTTQPSVGEAKP